MTNSPTPVAFFDRTYDEAMVLIREARDYFAERQRQPASPSRAAVELVDSVGLLWALCAFDEQGRLVALSPSASPSLESITALGELLERSSA